MLVFRGVPLYSKSFLKWGVFLGGNPPKRRWTGQNRSAEEAQIGGAHQFDSLQGGKDLGEQKRYIVYSSLRSAEVLWNLKRNSVSESSNWLLKNKLLQLLELSFIILWNLIPCSTIHFNSWISLYNTQKRLSVSGKKSNETCQHKFDQLGGQQHKHQLSNEDNKTVV